MKRYQSLHIVHIILLMFCSLSVQASLQSEPDSIWITGIVRDDFTREALGDVKIELLSFSGDVINSIFTRKRTGNFSNHPINFGLNVARGAKSIMFRLSKEGYNMTETTQTIKIGKRENTLLLKDILIRKLHQLSEAVVTASKVKMVIKGDTIEYNADAFQLSEGSMLDALIRQLPGVELEEGGRIMVNGRFVSSLLVNGEDFFKGDPKIALDNLPAYMVNKIRVYEKGDADDYLHQQRPNEEKPLVVDVNLKKQYATGWIANAEAGYGTRNKYLARVFGLRFTDNSRLAIFANLNNINNTQEPGNTGSWNSVYSVSGITHQKSGGLDLLIKDKEGAWKYQGDIKARHEDINIQQESSTIRFFEEGDIYNRSLSVGKDCRTTVTTRHKWEFPMERLYLCIEPTAEYRYINRNSLLQVAEFECLPYESYHGAAIDSIFQRPGTAKLEQFMTHRLEQFTMEQGYQWNGKLSAQGTWKIPHSPDVLWLQFQTSVERKNHKPFSTYDLRYSSESKGNDYRNRYTLLPEKVFDFSTHLIYYMKNSRYFQFNPEYQYTHSYSAANRALYRLDKYDAWNDPTHPQIGVLPSTTDSLNQAIDRQNSYHSRIIYDEHRLTPQLVFFPNKGQDCVIIEPAIRYKTDHIVYRRDTYHKQYLRRDFFFEPSVSYSFCAQAHKIEYRLRMEQPMFTNQMDITDNANPIYIRKGNPHLKNTRTHQFSFSGNWPNNNKGRTTHVNANYFLYENAIGYATLYNRSTGITTTTPMNINGNWSLSGNVSHNTPLDKKRRLVLSTNTYASYHNSVDFASADTDTPLRSSVRNFNLEETLKLTYQIGKHSIGAKADVNWRHATSQRTDFNKINTADMFYGITGQICFPWNLELSTDITLYSRCGYNDSSMNTTDIVWNARISKSLLKGNLVFAIDGFDMLQQLSNIHQSINAQGRTETRYNTVPAYFMARVIYRLNVKPKSRRE